MAGSPPRLPNLPDPALVMAVPFARTDTAGRYWPVQTANPKGREIAYRDIHSQQFGSPSRSFFANRDGGARHHVASIYGARPVSLWLRWKTERSCISIPFIKASMR